MRLRELLGLIDTPFDRYFHGYDAMMEALDLGVSWVQGIEEAGFRSRPVADWMCTDTVVGMHILYLHDEPFAVTMQTGRKNGVDLRWISEEIHDRVRKTVEALIIQEQGRPRITLANLDAEVPLTYKLGFSSQLMAKRVLHKGQLVDVVKTFHSYREGEWQHVVIRVDGQEVKVPMADIEVPVILKNG